MLKNIRLERPLVVFDLETTGKKVQTDRIVEISLLKLLPDGTNQIKTRRLNPGIPIPAEATAIHGITDADVANENYFRQIARSLATYLEGCDLCGYNIWIFDLRMLVNEFKRAEVPFSVEGRHIIDPCRIFHKREPRDLTAALRFFCRMEHEGAHGAEADVLAALLVLDGQVERYEDLPLTVVELTIRVPDGGSFLPAGQTQAVQQKPMSRYQQAKRQRQNLKIKANQLRQAGRTSKTFVQRELQR